MLRAVRPDLRFVDLRGNVETRLARLVSGRCDAAILARAALERLALVDHRAVTLESAVMMPAAGQRALGLEFRSDQDRVRALIAPLDDPPSRWAIVAERALLRRLGAGCRTALGALGQVDATGRLVLETCLAAPDGREVIRRRAEGPAPQARRVGSRLAEQLLSGPM